MNSIKHLMYTLAGGTLAFTITVGIAHVIESVQA